MNLGQTASQTVREAQRELARRAQIRIVPRVMYAGLGESAEAFGGRITEEHTRRHGRILAVVPYGMPTPVCATAVELPEKLFRILHPDARKRYRVVTGGRGSAKSHSFAIALVLRMVSQCIRLLCAREHQNSLRESSHHLLANKIAELGLSSFFEVDEREIRCSTTGSECIFVGLAANVEQLRSLEGIDICFIEQAESVSARSLEILIPTVRETGSEIWATANPEEQKAPIMEFTESNRADVAHLHVTYADNPFFPLALEAERVYLQSVDPNAYSHIYLGTVRTASEAQVFKGKVAIEAFEPVVYKPGVAPWDGPYLGCDWGFSTDPTALVKAWVSKRTLYVEHEAYGHRCDIDRTPELFDTVPDARKYVIRADNARPETISYMNRNGYRRVIGVQKWKGSVEDGISVIRSFEKIVIHPRCEHTAEEMRLYSYKVDRLSGDVMPDLIDKHNHTIDALRYALQPVIKRRKLGRFVACGGDPRAMLHALISRSD